MAELSPREAHQIARRLFLIQVLLNYRTMQGGGYLFALWPWIRRQEHRSEKVREAAGYINSHPVFASLAVGAIRRRLETRNLKLETPLPSVHTQAVEEFSVWRESLAGPLGVMGDALIWDRWKPLVFATGALIMLLLPDIKVWMFVAAASVVIYNFPLYLLRIWGIRTGYQLGSQVLEALRDTRFARWRARLTMAGVILSGALAGTALISGTQGNLLRAAQVIIASAVMFVCLRFRFSVSTAALVAIVASLAFSVVL